MVYSRSAPLTEEEPPENSQSYDRQLGQIEKVR
jgi:hypothetical protein